MNNQIRVSAHQFDKEAAIAHVNSILSNRRSRINGYFKKYQEFKSTYDAAVKTHEVVLKEFAKAKEEAGDDEQIYNDFKSKNQFRLDNSAEDVKLSKANMDGEYHIARQRRSKYRVSSTAAFSTYECTGKGGKNGEWVFEIKEVRYA